MFFLKKLKKYKGSRHIKLLYKNFLKKKSVKFFFLSLGNKNGWSKKNGIVARYKKNYFFKKKKPHFNFFQFSKNRINKIGYLKTIYYLKKINYICGIVEYSNGSKTLLKLHHSPNIGDFYQNIKFSHIFLKKFLKKKQNSFSFCEVVKNLTIISNFSMKKKTYKILYLKKKYIFFWSFLNYYLKQKNTVFSTSPGTFSQIIYKDIEFDYSIIRISSGKKFRIANNTPCIVGRNANKKHKFEIQGKAGLNKYLGKRSIVRGVARNPIDHPNGGRTKVNSPERSIWGWIAKKNF